jgi:hypothetical protein
MLADMAVAFTTLWTQDTCRELRRAGRVGMRPPVAFSGVHTSLPSWVSVNVGDDVYALHVNRGVVYVVSRLRFVDKQRRGCCGTAPATRNRRGVTRGLKHVVDGRLERALGLHGIYRLTSESADELAALVDNAPAPNHAATTS